MAQGLDKPRKLPRQPNEVEHGQDLCHTKIPSSTSALLFVSVRDMMDVFFCEHSVMAPEQSTSAELSRDTQQKTRDSLLLSFTPNKPTSLGTSSSTKHPASGSGISLEPVTSNAGSKASPSPSLLHAQCIALPRIATQPNQQRPRQPPPGFQNFTYLDRTTLAPQSGRFCSATNVGTKYFEKSRTHEMTNADLKPTPAKEKECVAFVTSSQVFPQPTTTSKLPMVPVHSPVTFAPSPPSQLRSLKTHVIPRVPATLDPLRGDTDPSPKKTGGKKVYEADCIEDRDSDGNFAAQDNLRQANRRLRKYLSKSDQLRHLTESKCRMLGALCVRRNLLTSDVVTMMQLVQTSRQRLDEQRVANKELMKYIDLLTGLEPSVNSFAATASSQSYKHDVALTTGNNSHGHS